MLSSAAFHRNHEEWRVIFETLQQLGSPERKGECSYAAVAAMRLTGAPEGSVWLGVLSIGAWQKDAVAKPQAMDEGKSWQRSFRSGSQGSGVEATEKASPNFDPKPKIGAIGKHKEVDSRVTRSQEEASEFQCQA